MNVDEFNGSLGKLTEAFITQWFGLVDEYAEKNELMPNHKLTCFLYSHLGIERAISDRVWEMGSEYVNEVVKVGKELRKDE